MSGPDVAMVTTRAQLEECWRIRFAVFVGEQAVPAEMEVDDLDTDPTTTHVLATADGRPVATARLLPGEPGEVRIGRVAVARSARGTGVGRAVMEALHEVALATHAGPDGTVRVDIEAQEQAIPFYAGLGYGHVDDRRYLDAGIWHRDMALHLSR